MGVYAPLPIAGRVSLRPFCPLIVTNDVVVNRGCKKATDQLLSVLVVVVIVKRGAKIETD